jgi:hypothetical protein
MCHHAWPHQKKQSQFSSCSCVSVCSSSGHRRVHASYCCVIDDGKAGYGRNMIIKTPDHSTKNVVRDRTLVLRVLVPGLHTSLHDKINANNRTVKDEQPSSASSSSRWSTDAASLLLSGSMSGGGGGGEHHHQILNLEGVSCIPSSKGSTLWHFRCDGATYPARLVNLPW